MNICTLLNYQIVLYQRENIGSISRYLDDVSSVNRQVCCVARLSGMTARWILIIVAGSRRLFSAQKTAESRCSSRVAAAMLSASSCHQRSITCYTLHTGLLACYTHWQGEAQALSGVFTNCPLSVVLEYCQYSNIYLVAENVYQRPTWSMKRGKSAWYLIMARPDLLITSVQSAPSSAPPRLLSLSLSRPDCESFNTRKGSIW